MRARHALSGRGKRTLASLPAHGHVSTSPRARVEHSAGTAATDDPRHKWRINLTGKDAEWLREMARITSLEHALTSSPPSSAAGEWYTGKHPTRTPGFDRRTGLLHSLAQPNLNGIDLATSLAYFDNSWTIYENLFAGVLPGGEESFFRPPYHALRHPLQFYYCHPAALYINKLHVAGLVDKTIDVHFERLFEVGVDEMSWDDLTLGDKLWPRVSEVHRYRKEAYKLVRESIEREYARRGGRAVRVDWADPLWAFHMGIEHERIHVETSSVLMRELPLHLVRRPAHFPPPPRATATRPQAAPSNRLQHVFAQPQPRDRAVVALGRNIPLRGRDDDAAAMTDAVYYGWDNEFGQRRVELDSRFRASAFKTTNAEMLEFVKAGGYVSPEYWEKEGYDWRRFRNVLHPTFWVNRGPAHSTSHFAMRHIFELGPIDWAAPVVVNFHEARAFCNWKAAVTNTPGLRLPTEAEDRAVMAANESASSPLVKITTVENVDDDPAAWSVTGRDVDQRFGINVNLAHGGERAPLVSSSSSGFPDARGNVWCWLEDHMNPLEGSKAHPYYLDFTEPCYDGKHQMIVGGSFISTGECTNRFARFQFRPHFFQQAGFRYVAPGRLERYHGESGGVALLARSPPAASAAILLPAETEEKKPSRTGKTSSTPRQTQADYENNVMVEQYLDLHFGQRDPERYSPRLRPEMRHALDFPRRAARRLMELTSRRGVALDLGCAVGGSSLEMAKEFAEVRGVDLSRAFVETAARRALEERVTNARFEVGDACGGNLGLSPASLDAILCANLICRLPDPEKCFREVIDAALKPGGVVLFTSPHSWMESFTPREKWMGTVGDARGEALIRRFRAAGYDLLAKEDIPLLIRDHDRKFQYISAHLTAFKKK